MQDHSKDASDKVLEKAKRDAFEEISSLGLVVNISACEKPDFTIITDLDLTNIDNCCDDACEDSNNESSIKLDHADHGDSENVSEHSNLIQDSTILTSLKGPVELIKLNETKKLTTELNIDSPFTVVTDSFGKESIIRKSSICWLLNKDSSKLSSDRLVRVRENEIKKVSDKRIITNDLLKRSSEIYIGEWCLFEKLESKK